MGPTRRGATAGRVSVRPSSVRQVRTRCGGSLGQRDHGEIVSPVGGRGAEAASGDMKRRVTGG
eukprot:scaffold102419_cov39-Phaeocystis_antarctica.AAC.1